MWVDSVTIQRAASLHVIARKEIRIFSYKTWMGWTPSVAHSKTRLDICNLLTCFLSVPQFLCSGVYLCENTAAYYKLINYSVEVLMTRLAKWLPINKTLRKQITLAIILLLSQFLKTGTVQCSICFPAELNSKIARRNNCKCQGCLLTTKSVAEMWCCC